MNPSESFGLVNSIGTIKYRKILSENIVKFCRMWQSSNVRLVVASGLNYRAGKNVLGELARDDVESRILEASMMQMTC